MGCCSLRKRLHRSTVAGITIHSISRQNPKHLISKIQYFFYGCAAMNQVHLIGECDATRFETQDTASSATTASSPTTATQTLMNLRSGERINRAVQERFDPTAWERDGGMDTDMDLLIDGLHEISNDEGH